LVYEKRYREISNGNTSVVINFWHHALILNIRSFVLHDYDTI
jgi:hypothetical protein